MMVLDTAWEMHVTLIYTRCIKCGSRKVAEYKTIEVTSLGAVGAEVTGIDLASCSDDALEEMRRAYANHSVLFFRDQKLTPDQHLAFAERWGEVNINRFFKPVDGHPSIALVVKEPDQKANIGGGWHTDHSYDQIPALGSMLYAHEVPPTGGDTLFASTCAAYDSLSDGLKETLGTLSALHSAKEVFGSPEAYGDFAGRFGNAEAADVEAVHPVVITHPLSGRKSLYINGGFTRSIEGWSVPESEALLNYLYAHVARPEHTYRFQWQAGSMAFWDNRATWHLAVNDYHGHRRLMHRITLEGEAVHA